MTKHLYTVKFAVLWKAPGRKSLWDEDQILNLVGNGDARPVIKKAEVRAFKMRLDERNVWDVDRVSYGSLYHVARFRLLSVEQRTEIDS